MTFLLVSASPRPILTTIFLSLGTAKIFLSLRSFFKSDKISLLYFWCNNPIVYIFFLHFLQILNFLSPSKTTPTRVGLWHLGQRSATLPRLRGLGNSMIPPLSFSLLFLRCLLERLRPGIRTVLPLSIRRSILPRFPKSFPAVIIISSPFFSFIFNRLPRPYWLFC